VFFFNPSPVRRVPIPNKYTSKAKLCFCKNNKRMIIKIVHHGDPHPETGLISQQYWEQSKWYFVNVERGNIADKLQPRNINVSFNNNSNVPIDVIIFTFYSDQLTIDVETGIVTK